METPKFRRKTNNQSDESINNSNGVDEFIDDMSDAAQNVANKAQDGYQKGMNSAKRLAKEVKDDMESELSDEMKQEGCLGFALYLYAVLGYGIFCVESLTCLLLLVAWVVAYERNKNLMKMILSIIALYLGLKIGYSLFLNAYSLINLIIPNWDIFDFVVDLLSNIKKIVAILYDFVFVAIGVVGIARARKGKYFKVKFIEDLID